MTALATPSTDHTTAGFGGPGLICARCAQDARRPSEQTAPPFDVLEIATRLFPIQPRFAVGGCWACGDLTDLLTAEEFGVAAPTKAVHAFAAAVVDAWCGKSSTEQMRNVTRARARSESGRYWVEFKPAGSAYIHTQATRNPAEAVAQFVQAAV